MDYKARVRVLERLCTELRVERNAWRRTAGQLRYENDQLKAKADAHYTELMRKMEGHDV